MMKARLLHIGSETQPLGRIMYLCPNFEESRHSNPVQVTHRLLISAVEMTESTKLRRVLAYILRTDTKSHCCRQRIDPISQISVEAGKLGVGQPGWLRSVEMFDESD